MTRQNFLGDEPWDDTNDEFMVRSRVFWRPDDATLGATLLELQPGSPGGRLHMHYGGEEMFFVVSGRPTLRDGRTAEQLAPGDFVFCPEGRAGLHVFTNPTDEPVRILAISAGRFPDVVAYPEDGYAWVASGDPELVNEGRTEGIIARFEIPREQ